MKKIQLTLDEKNALIEGRSRLAYTFRDKYVWGSTNSRTKWAVIFLFKGMYFQWTYEEYENGYLDTHYDYAHRVLPETKTITEWKLV